MSNGGLPGRRPDQYQEKSPRGTTPGARIQRLGGTPDSADALGINQQAPTSFHNFTNPARLFTAGLTYAVGSNASYASSVSQFYARLTTLSGLVLCSIQLVIAGPSQGDSNVFTWNGPDTGVPVFPGDQLILDVNNGVPVAGNQGLMRADCEVFFTKP